jgi:predicted ATPase/DNA-binding winged helix-turn-helix (wHTH) protein
MGEGPIFPARDRRGPFATDSVTNGSSLFGFFGSIGDRCEEPAHVADPVFLFGPFRLAPAQRALFQDDKLVRLGSRALDLLIALVQHAGELVPHEALVAHVWPNLHVDEGSLRVHIAALRKVLGDGGAGRRYIANIPGRGYCFVATVRRREDPVSAAPAARGAAPTGNLPVSLTPVIGRAEIIRALAAQLQARRFLTILGPGGIGKTTVAVAIAESLADAYADGVWFVGLASLGSGDPALVPAAVMSALGQASLGSDAMVSLTAYLRDKRVLIVLDNCEHVIEESAAVAVALLKAAPGVNILATSREALRADGEWIRRLPSLALPPSSDTASAADALTFPAIQLFNQCAMASLDEFSLTDDNVATVVEICRRLDGIPLALELVAARVDVYGINGLASRINDHLTLATRGRRTALPRHQTLRAALDWSYDLLTDIEAALLRRLAIFADHFSLNAAIAVAADLSDTAVVEHIPDLVAKSLIVADLSEDYPEYRLPVTTRLYALEKLRSAGEYREAARRHAEYCRERFAHAEADSETRPQAEWLSIYGRHIDDVRAALGWAFSPEGDAAIGVALTVAVVPLWVQLSLLGECAERVERALASLEAGAAAARPRMQLSAALGWSLMYGVGRIREAGSAWATTLSLADELGDKVHRLRALWGLCIDQFNNGEFRSALGFAQRFAEIVATSNDPIDQMMADRLLGTTLHYLGDQNDARRHIESVIAHLDAAAPRSPIVRFRFDLRVSTHYFRARILWLQGFAEQALRQVECNIEEGRAIGHALTYCSVLGQAACPIVFLAGDLGAAARYGAMLLEHTERHPIRPWHQWARCFNAVVMIKRGELAAGLGLLRRELDLAGDARFLPRFLLPLGELAAGLGAAGEVAAGVSLVDETLARCRARAEGWYVAELLRIKGELQSLEGAPASVRAAEECFAEALAVARRQGALFWQLRSALSLARLRVGQGRCFEARRALAPVYANFSEGFETADLRAARSLLETLPRA